jgi:hypothetical protein
MFDYFRQVAVESRGIRRLIDQCREDPKRVHGVSIRVDSTWLFCWQIGAFIDPDHPQRGWDSFRWFEELGPRDWHWLRRFGWPRIHHSHREEVFEMVVIPALLNAWGLALENSPRPMSPDDLLWRPEMPGPWHHEPALVVEVALHPGAEGPLKLGEFRDDQIPFRVEQRRRYVPRTFGPIVRGGFSIGEGSQDPGTIGGMLENGTNHYALTCGHVVGASAIVDMPAQADNGFRPSPIGQVVAHELPPLVPPGTSTMIASGLAGPLDVALVRIDPSLASAGSGILRMGKLAGRMSVSALYPGQTLQFDGKTSSSTSVVEARGHVVYQQIEDAASGDYFCYEKLIQMRKHSGSRPSQPGDSGAWIAARDSSQSGSPWSWVAMLVGGDQQLSFAQPADDLNQWLVNKSYHLSIR